MSFARRALSRARRFIVIALRYGPAGARELDLLVAKAGLAVESVPMTMLAQVRSNGLLRDDEFSGSSEETRVTTGLLLGSR